MAMKTGRREIRRETTDEGVSAEPVAYNARVYIMTADDPTWIPVV